MLKPHPFTVDDFMVMVNAGLFEDQRVELLDGMIVDMSPADPNHEYVIDKLVKAFYRALPDDVLIRGQNSIGINYPEWLPHPDIAIVKPNDYTRARPTPDDTLLLIKVADTSLRLDLGRKREVYADVGIQEYWVADLSSDTWMIHRNPKGERYGTIFEVPFGKAVAPLAFPDDARAWL